MKIMWKFTKISDLVNDCYINNGNCSHQCLFDYINMLDFYCDCPEGFKLDVTQYNCEPIRE